MRRRFTVNTRAPNVNRGYRYRCLCGQSFGMHKHLREHQAHCYLVCVQNDLQRREGNNR